MVIENRRYQRGLKMEHLFPKRNDKKCACGCGSDLPKGKRRWYSEVCQKKSLIQFLIIKGDHGVIRSELFKTDQGYCRNCGVYDIKWQADHILAVINGGGGKGIENYQTLCLHCHKEKTKNDLRVLI
ncbi:HNH endonuclease [Chryseobacterium bernardetii]|uniref:HNH endonuclease n=1 Tax=Chryseobacterium bernardetii TaxID=1241978 RepID=UPI001627E408|nr:HNH endonuclease [Chryseobacterium bernardetii]